jgi:AP-4 complex subunit mu-1
VSPTSTLELLNRLAKVFKDYCGVLTEESIRRNFTLVYELLDEMMDFGYPQITSTEMLKNHIHNEAHSVGESGPVATATSSILSSITMRTKPSNSTNVPMSVGLGAQSKTQKNEIYVDIVERLTVLFNGQGNVVNSSVNGSIQMKSFLSGNPELKLALNEDLVIGKGTGGHGSVVLDDCNFHECVRLDQFESQRMLHFFPPDGEFALLNYRVTADFAAPFRILPTVVDVDKYKVELNVVVKADIPEGHHGANVTIKIPMPRCTAGVTFEFPSGGPGMVADYVGNEKTLLWNIRKFVGGSELSIKCKITLSEPVTALTKREVGPVAMAFEIPMYNVSNVQVKYLRISETHKSYNPYRWVRYITQSSSYVARIPIE